MTIDKFESNNRYLASWSAELTSKANRVRDLIGSRHWLSDGQHKESIVRDMLKHFLPPTSKVGSGFIKSFNSGEVSNEIDILISDLCSLPPLYNEGGIQIIFPESLIAAIEMKSSFSYDSLEKSISLIRNLGTIINEIEHTVWRCILFVNIETSFDNFINTTQNKIENVLLELKQNSSVPFDDLRFYLPTCISSFDKYSLFIKFDKYDNSLKLNFFDTQEQSASVIFADLFDSVYQHFNKGARSPLSDFVLDMSDSIIKTTHSVKY